MINHFIYKQLQKITSSVVLFSVWIGTTFLLSSLLYSIFKLLIRLFLGVYQQGQIMGKTGTMVSLLPSKLPELSFEITFIMASIFFLLMLFVVYRYYRQLEFAFGSLQTGDKATGRFTTDREIKEQYKEINKYQKVEVKKTSTFNVETRKALEEERRKKNKEYQGLAGTLVARIDDKLYIDTDDAHGLILGRTRSGKTQTKVLSDIEIASRSQEKPHMIISSGKYELLQGTQTMLKERGYRLGILNLIDMERSEQFNPLSLIANAYLKEDYDEAIELCKTFSFPLYHNENAKEPVWEETAMALVNALILALCHEFIGEGDNLKEEGVSQVNMYNVAQMLNSLGETESGNSYLLDTYFDSLDLNSPARLEYSTVRMSTSQMRSSIFTSAQAKIRQFTARRVAKLMDTTSFSFDEFIKKDETGNIKPIAFFLVLPDYVETNYIIATTWLQQCYYYLSQYASLHNDRLPKRIFHHFDEFGNMPSFSGIGSMLTVGAGRGLLYNLYLQDLVQFDIKYGSDISRLLRSQTMNRFFILSGDSETRREFSEWLGSREFTQKSRSGTFMAMNKTVTENVETRPLLTPDELGRLKEGEIVVERSTKRTDLKGRKIRPYPIFNTGEKREFEYSYDYLGSLVEKIPISELDLPYITDDSLHNNEKAFVHKIEMLKRGFEQQEQDRKKEEQQAKASTEKTSETTNPSNVYSGYNQPMASNISEFDPQSLSDLKKQLAARVAGTSNAFLVGLIQSISTIEEFIEFKEEYKDIFQ